MTSFSPRLLVSAAALAASFAVSSNASAGPVEILMGFAQAPNDPQQLVLRYDNALGGLLFSHNGGTSFVIYPGRSVVDDGFRTRAPMVFTNDGHLLIGLPDGLAYDDGTGCDIRFDSTLKNREVTAIERHPSDPNVMFVLTAGSTNNSARSGLWKRDGAGMLSALSGNDTGTQMGTPDYNNPVFSSKGLRVVARSQSTQGLRFVEVGFKVANNADRAKTTRTPMFRYSDDLGANWTEHPLASTATDEPALLVATGDEPMKALVVLRKTAAVDPPDVVLLTTDAGANFAPYIEGIISVGQVVQTPDGHLYIADEGASTCTAPTGLWMAPQLGAKAERITNEAVTCLGYDAAHEALYFCKRGYELGRFYPSTGAYCRLSKISDVTDFSCPAIVPNLSDPDAGPRLSDADAGIAHADDQLCGGWCGPTHYAFSAFCDKTSCVANGRAYDMMAGWVAAPGDGEPSCNGFTGGNIQGSGLPAFCGGDADGGIGNPSSDAGSTGASDGGVANDAGGGAGGTAPNTDGGMATDAGVHPNADAAVSHTEAGAGEPDMGSDGCDCSAAHRGSRPPDLAGFALGLWLLVRGRRRRARA